MTKFIILGQGRSGTTILTKTLAQHPELNVYQHEILCRHYGGLDKEITPLAGEGIMSPKDHSSICMAAYCRKAHEKYDGYKILIDHLKNDVLDYIKTVPTILVVRLNKLARYVSACVAEELQDWGSTDEWTGKIHVDPIYAGKVSRVHLQEDRNLISELNPLVVYYEHSIYDNVDSICDYLGIPRFKIEYSWGPRIRRPLSEVISNYDEVKHLDVEIKP